MELPHKIKLTDSPQSKRVSLTPMPSLEVKYPEPIVDDLYIKEETPVTNSNWKTNEDFEKDH